MKKRRFLMVFVMIACVVSVVGGHFFYNNKLEKNAYAAKREIGITEKRTASKKVSSEETPLLKENLFANAPEGIAELYKEKEKMGNPLKFHLVGSTNTSSDQGTWAQLFTTEMTNTYKEKVNLHTTSTGDMTSLELQDDSIYEEIQTRKSDVIIIEPPLLNDNDGISMRDTLFVLSNMIEGIKTSNPEAIILIQSSNPISKPAKYADQVLELENFAKEESITYLNIWSSWPSVDSEEIKDYYDSTTLQPNEKGHKLWADFMIKAFQ
ncbi:SGNH/GDSL hydrolase family protein [Fictibacillus nanhaiensis]|uniref:SGNH/GDSL hydrolase family protein n=1 Tax=Fictibacillus nanhaiensis TaxID=742169 RepID=A0ABS2ZMR9_9BACL|nr:SGNH/GDSL hydrolase family protein [Fictibacillus nanhaiensis]